MKVSLLVLFAVVLLVPVFSRRIPSSWGMEEKEHVVLSHLVRENDFCKTCVNFAQQTIQELLNLIVQGGVVGGCSKLCKALADATKIPFIEKTCDIVCSTVGIKAFVKFVEKADLNPIYLCELTKLCPVNDYGDAKITNLTVTPESGPQGQFAINFKYVSNNGTGTGEIALAIKTVDGIVQGGNFFHEAAPAGRYSGSFKIKAVPDPSCDPSQQPCEKWLPGLYNVNVAICNGICGSKRPHSSVYNTAKSSFSITSNDDVAWLIE